MALTGTNPWVCLNLLQLRQPATGQISCTQYKKFESMPDEEIEYREQLTEASNIW